MSPGVLLKQGRSKAEARLVLLVCVPPVSAPMPERGPALLRSLVARPQRSSPPACRGPHFADWGALYAGGARSMAAAPMYVQQRVVGVLNLASKDPHAFDRCGHATAA